MSDCVPPNWAVLELRGPQFLPEEPSNAALSRFDRAVVRRRAGELWADHDACPP